MSKLYFPLFVNCCAFGKQVFCFVFVIYLFIYFCGVLGFELQVLYLLGWHSTTLATSPALKSRGFFFFFLFLGFRCFEWDWGLDFGLCICKAGALPPEPHLQSILL
jgi:hypothetical protein